MTEASLGMPDMVLALPIKGESFLLRCAGRTIVVDGGWKTDDIAGVLARHVGGKTRLDIVVCTHGDADHAGGLSALLNSWQRRVHEVWLPGRWVDVVPNLTKDPDGFVRSLIRELDLELRNPSAEVLEMIDNFNYVSESSDVNERPELQTEEGILEEDHLAADDSWSNDIEEPRELKEPEWFSSLRETLDQFNPDNQAERVFALARNRVLYRRRREKNNLQKDIASYWLKLIETCEAIRSIAVAAIRHGILTRWFDVEAFKRDRRRSGGYRGVFEPVNAKEQAPPPNVDHLYNLLTRINEESLVFLAPVGKDRLGVLFCADSPLGDGVNYQHSFLPPARRSLWPLVVTAPHHGSESNKVAYGHLKKWARPAVLLRTGGSKKQPGVTFLGQRGALKLCAKCPKAGLSPVLTGVFSYLRCARPMMRIIGRRCKCSPPAYTPAGLKIYS